MTPAEFRSYAELAGWLVIGLYLLGRLVRGDREISVRIGGSKRKVKLGELAQRVEQCEGKLHTVDEERRGRVPAAAYEWVEKTNKEVEEKLQALDERHDHLALANSAARRMAEEAIDITRYSEQMIDRTMPVLAWLAWRAGMKLIVTKCEHPAGGARHREKVVELARDFRDEVDGQGGAPPDLRIVANHSPFVDDADEYQREVPDHASINSLDALLKVTRDELVALKRNLRLHPGEGDKRGLLSGNGMGDLIDLLTAALFADEIPKEPREFSRQFRNALRLSLRTAGESDAAHIPAKAPVLDEIEWSVQLRRAAKTLGCNNLTAHDALGVETPWGLAYMSLQRPLELWFVLPEPQGARKVVEFIDGLTDDSQYVAWEDSRHILHTRKIVCVGNEGDLVNGRLASIGSGMKEGTLNWADFLKDVAAAMGHAKLREGQRVRVETDEPETGTGYLALELPDVIEFAVGIRRRVLGGNADARTIRYVDANGNGRAGRICALTNPRPEESLADVDSKAGAHERDFQLRCTPPAPHPDDPITTPRVSMCADCGKVETADGELCKRCTTKQIEKENRAKCVEVDEADAKTANELWRESLREIASRLGDAELTMDSRILLETKSHGPAYLAPDCNGVILIESGHYNIDEIEVWDDPAGPLVRYHDSAGIGYFGKAVSMTERATDVERAFREHREESEPRTVVGTATVTVTFDEALKQATNPPPAVMQFWEQMQEAQSLLALFDEQHQLTLYTFGVAGPGYPEVGAPVISGDGVLAARVMDYNGDRDNAWWATCESVPNPAIARSAQMFCLPVIRLIEWADREGYR